MVINQRTVPRLTCRPPIDMGDHIFLACFPTMKEVETFFDRVLEEK